MMCFLTKSGTYYYLDTINHLFWGGRFTNPVRYSSASCIVGNKGVIQLADGRLVTTSVIVSYQRG